MSNLPETRQSFPELLDAIEKHAPDEVAGTFREPADDAAIARIERLLGAPLPEQLRQLLLWHDGQAWNSPLRENDNRRLLCVDEIIDAMEFFLSPDEDFLEPWGRHWVPFLTNDSGDYVVVDASAQGGGALIAYWHDWDDRSVRYRSLHEWAAGLAEELEQAGA